MQIWDPSGHRTKDESWASRCAHSEIRSEWDQSWNKTRKERSRLNVLGSQRSGMPVRKAVLSGETFLSWHLPEGPGVPHRMSFSSVTPTRHRNLQGCSWRMLTSSTSLLYRALTLESRNGGGFWGIPERGQLQGGCCAVAPTLCNPMDCSTPGFPVLHHLPELAQTHVHWVSDVIQPSHPLFSPSPPTFYLSEHQGLFKWVGSLHRVSKVLELQHQSLQWIFRVDFF